MATSSQAWRASLRHVHHLASRPLAQVPDLIVRDVFLDNQLQALGWAVVAGVGWDRF